MKRHDRSAGAQPAKRPVLIIVPHWPDGTMAFKFGGAMKSALGIERLDGKLLQFAPERIFRIETDVSEDQFRKRLASYEVSCHGSVHFVDMR